MNFFRRTIAKALLKSGMAVAGEWEGHRNSRRHEDLPSSMLRSQDDSLERTGNREQMMGAARSMCNLFGLGNRILRTYANYVIGGSCEVFFHTEDEKWNDLASESVNSHCKLIDARGREDLAGLARMGLIHMIRDGDIGFAKVLNGSMPLLEPIEADRIGPSSMVSMQPGLVGGVQLDRVGRPLTYHVATRGEFGMFRDLKAIPASGFLHMFDNMRFDSTRGVSFFSYGALGRSRSLRQIIRCEEVGVETANKWAVFLKTHNAAFSAGNIPGFTLEDDDTPTKNATASPKVEDVYDGMIQRLEPGEEIQTAASNRPSNSWQGFVEFLIHDYAVSLDLPFEFVWSMASMSGPGVRMASKQAERTFRHMWDVINRRFFVPSIAWIVAAKMESGELPFNAEWYDFTVQRGDHPTIDVGRESAANISEWEKGWISGAEVTGERGRNIYRVMRQKARELQYAHDLAKEFPDVAASDIINTQKQGAAPANPSQPNPQPNQDQEDEEAPKQPGKQQREQPGEQPGSDAGSD
jgi:capsid protein